MNLAQVARVLAGFAVFFTVVQSVPLLFAAFDPSDEHHSPLGGFTASIGIGALVSGLLGLAGRGATGSIYRKEAIAIAGIAWVLAGVLGAIPFQWSGLLRSPVDAVFESISGLTTCGATVLGSGSNPAPEAVPSSLLLWRAMIQWFGGLGIVLVFVALLPAMGVTGKNLMTSETVGVTSESYQPRVLGQARAVVLTYVGLTVACLLLLLATGGMTAFEATCHAFTALSTGGYSTRTSLAAFDHLGVELVLILFMFVGGCSMAVLVATIRQRGRGPGALWRTGEFRVYTAFVAGIVAALTISLMSAGRTFGTALREAGFNAVSVITSTGYATADYQVWPSLCLLLLACSMVVGGCSGSTAGGLKQVRLRVALNLLTYSLRHFVRPKSVERLKLDGEVLQAQTVSAILAMVLLWLLTLVAGACVLACDPRLDFTSALTASASMLGSTGPAMAHVPMVAELPAFGMPGPMPAGPNIGPFGGYGDLRPWTKLVLAFEMILGRLELLTPLALLSPGFWRR